MEWQVFGVIVAIVSFAIAVGTPVLKLNKSINILTVHVENFHRLLEEFKADNKGDHEELKKKLDNHEERITETEKDIAVIQSGLRGTE